MKNAEIQCSIDFTGSASSAVAPVQVVQISGANVVQNSGSVNCTGCTSILDVEISCFANYRTTEPKPVNLLKWLKSDKYAKEVQAIRATTDKGQRDKLKSTIQAITPSGIFSKREAAGLIKHSGFIQFDIDGVQDIEATKQKIISLSNVAYCGLSVSGRGLWGLIPIVHPDHHKEYFLLIEKAFAGMGIKVDTSCKDVTRLRGYSYDPDGYFNYNAKPLVQWYEPKRKAPKRHTVAANFNDNTTHVEICLQQITARNIDLTANYSDWFSIGCSLANEFGENGRDYFHTVSQFHPEYNYQKTDKQFTQCLKSGFHIQIGHFFNRCKEAGITFKQIAPVQNGENYPIDNQLIKWCNTKDRIGIAPIAPVEEKAPDLPKWFVDGQGILKRYEAGEITDDEYLDLLQTNLESSGLTGQEYASQTNELEPIYRQRLRSRDKVPKEKTTA